MAHRVYRVIDHPDLQQALRTAPPELLRVLSHRIYPLLRSDPTDIGKRWPITWQPPWFVLRIQITEGLALLAYQVLEDQLLVMARYLLWTPTTLGSSD
jgi:hypothetical protein